MMKNERQKQVLIDTLSRLLDEIRDAEDIGEDGQSNLPGNIAEARDQAEHVLARLEER